MGDEMTSRSRQDARRGRLTKPGKPAKASENVQPRDSRYQVARGIGSPEESDNSATLVPAAVRTLRIFEVFERFGQPLTLSRLAEEIDVPISSCHNLVRTLIAQGYLFSLESQRAFYPTRRIWDLANAIVAHDPILQRILPTVEKLRDATS